MKRNEKSMRNLRGEQNQTTDSAEKTTGDAKVTKYSQSRRTNRKSLLLFHSTPKALKRTKLS